MIISDYYEFNYSLSTNRNNPLILFYLDNNPTKITIHSDHTHIFDTVHVDTCDETCAVEDIIGTVILDTNGIDSGCNPEQCCMYFFSFSRKKFSFFC